MTEQVTEDERKLALIQESWKRGILDWKLHKYQRPIYDAINSDEHPLYCVNCSRRYGKSTVTIIIALEKALQNKNFFIRFVSATQKDMRDIVDTIMTEIVADAPPDVKPIWKGQDGYYYFPSTGSRIYVSGANNGHEDDSRGRRMDLGIVDEASLVDRLTYLINSVLNPQLLTTGGRIIMTYTPPETPDHPIKEFNDTCKERGAYFERTIWDMVDQGHITFERVKEIADGFLRGFEDTGFQREYECAFVVEHERVIVPEWNDVVERTEDGDIITVGDTLTWEPEIHDDFFRYYDKYVSMDLGTKHYTCALFGYYDFLNGRLVIQDEWKLSGPEMTTTVIHDSVQAMEQDLWTDHVGRKYRIADNNNLQLLNDLVNEFNMPFRATGKSVRGDSRRGALAAMINLLRMEVSMGTIAISPKCKFLIGCLRNGIWDKNRREWEESQTYGHYDGIAALMYLIYNLDKSHNPIPTMHGFDPQSQFMSEQHRKKRESQNKQRKDDARQWKEVFDVKR